MRMVRFTTLSAQKAAAAPSFSDRHNRYVFLVMACAEVMLLMSLGLSFWVFLPKADPSLLGVGTIVAIAAGSFLVRRSVFLAQAVLFFSLLASELLLYLYLPLQPIPITLLQYEFALQSAHLPLVFLVVDLGLMLYFYRAGASLESEPGFMASESGLAHEDEKPSGIGEGNDFYVDEPPPESGADSNAESFFDEKDGGVMP